MVKQAIYNPSELNGSVASHQLPRTGVLSVCADDEVIDLHGAVRKGHPDLVAVDVLQLRRREPKDVLVLVLHDIVQDPNQVAAHDLELGSRALPALPGLVRLDHGHAPAGLVDELHALLVHELLPDLLFQPHQPHDGESLAPEIDLLALGAEVGAALDYGDGIIDSLEAT
jgi:hypothetical protein